MDRQFSQPGDFLEGLPPDEVAAIVSTSTDVALFVDGNDTVRDISCSLSQVADADLNAWLDASIEDVVAASSVPQLSDLMMSARRSETAYSCQISHPLKAGGTLAVQYSARSLGSEGGVILLGSEFTSFTALRNHMTTIARKMEDMAESSLPETPQHPSLSEMIYQSSSKKVRGAKTPGFLTAQVGAVPLKELVRETTDLIEKDCLVTALHLTGNNRALAARVLGMSRQSLYIKMRRYGLVDESDD